LIIDGIAIESSKVEVSRQMRHIRGAISMRQRPKPNWFCTRYGTAEAVPYKDLESLAQAPMSVIE
jgi:hypothetical protein